MPALFVMLVIIIIKSLSMPGSIEGLKFMFVPGYAVSGGFIESAPSISTVLATAGGQMFFSLSLAMGAMITYGSYIDKKENLVRNSTIIVISDTTIAIMAGIAVIPAAVAYGIQQGIPVGEIALGGPSLLFVTLQNVFNSMGSVGALFGTNFYLLVLIAAITSGISLIEVISTFFLDRAAQKGRKASRPRIVLLVCLAILAEATLVAVDGLGSNGIAPFNLLGMETNVTGWNDCWLDFMDMLSEGLAMPLGAMLMSIMIGWEIHPKSMLDEIHSGAGSGMDGFFSVCMKIIAPLGMVLILSGQISDFFGKDARIAGYIIGIVVYVIGVSVAVTSPMRKAAYK
ncbi:hypothetical protein SDC9_84922 [bioreactor metagenome]|uniref:Sodium:neurotransmitter symporter family protein n=1 Tax=bioreactor metagenome TaxID=1076179 RepID=A0A644ZHX1_9ZZZZ